MTVKLPPARGLVTRSEKQWEQVAFAEVLVPDVVNSYGDIYTREAVVEFAYEFARQGYGLDVDHDNVNVDGTKYYVVESFIARDGDPDFIDGSWVVGVKILDADLWSQILDGQINGFSFEAEVGMQPVTFLASDQRVIVGTTEPNPLDGHTHVYTLVLDAMNRPFEGGTSVTDGHSHRIVTHTVTEVSDGHNHRYQVIVSNPDTELVEDQEDVS